MIEVGEEWKRGKGGWMVMRMAQGMPSKQSRLTIHQKNRPREVLPAQFRLAGKLVLHFTAFANRSHPFKPALPLSTLYHSIPMYQRPAML